MSDMIPPEVLHTELKSPFPPANSRGWEIAFDAGVSFVRRTDSTNIANLVFEHAERRMTVGFRNGSIYAYEPVAWETFREIANAESAGGAFHHHVRKAPPGTYTTTKLDAIAVLARARAEAPIVITDDDLEDSLDPYDPPSLPPQMRPQP